jgi:LPXTG-motif cell wall-anchored protein
MDTIMVTRIVAGVLFVLVLGFLIQRRRKSVR